LSISGEIVIRIIAAFHFQMPILLGLLMTS
jgi:hypothetical protein